MTYKIIDNIFDNPDEFIELSRVIRYYTFEDKTIECVPLKEDLSKFPTGWWRGYRSDRLNDIDQNLFDKTFDRISNKTFQFNRENINSYIAVIPNWANTLTPIDQWWHKDDSSYAGVVYLNKNPEKNSGTVIMDNGKEVIVENKYNRLVMYDRIFHRPERFFGINIFDFVLNF
jgi:hypothetical protein